MPPIPPTITPNTWLICHNTCPAATALTAAELINMGRYAWSGLLGRSSKADKQAVAEAFALTHTEKFADQIVDTLSGGERSRSKKRLCR